jgi:sulfatase-like protein
VAAALRLVKTTSASWNQALKYGCAWFPVAAVALYVKYELVLAQSAFGHLTRALGKTSPAELTNLEKLSLFRVDLLANLVAIPVALAVVMRYLPSRARFAAAALFCALIAIVLYAQLKALLVLQRFVSLDLMLSGARWGFDHGESITAFVGMAGIVKLVAVCGTSIAICEWARRAPRGGVSGSDVTYEAGAAIAIVIAALTAIAVPRAPLARWNHSAVSTAFAALWISDEIDTSEFAHAQLPELAREFRQLTSSPEHVRDDRFWGRAAGSDLIFFVLETVPAQSVALAAESNDLPALRALKEHAIMASRHYSTYPATNRALFSILSSWYPPALATRYDQRWPQLQVPALPRILRAQGYLTTTYGPFPQDFEGEDRMYRALGVDRDAAGGPLVRFWQRSSWQLRAENDRAALELLKVDLTRNIRDGRRFVAVFMPQTGHFPLPDDSAHRSPAERAREIVRVQDGWLREIVDLLRREHRLDHTIIVVGGDHGFRIRSEEPALSGVDIDDRTFHVPLLVYTSALPQPQTVSWMTSHIDLSPTVLDLLGIESNRDTEQGLPIWDPRIAGRATFFLGRDYLGADGYHQDGEFSMWSWIEDAAYSTPRGLRFGVETRVATGSSRADAIRTRISRLTALGVAWADRLAGRQAEPRSTNDH